MTEILLYDSCDFWDSSFIGVGELSANNVIAKIEAAKEDELLVRIHSGGGFVFDGWAIYNALKNHPKKVTVRIEGIAASIASIIAMAGQEIIICEAAMLMIHKPSIDPWFYGSMDAEDLKREALTLDQIQAVLASIYVAKTGLDTAIINDMINAETYMTPTEAISFGFADRMDKTITETTIAENLFKHLFQNADAKTRAYANKALKITDMSKELQTSLKENTSLLKDIKNLFSNLFKNEEKEEEVTIENASSEKEDGTSLYYTGDLAEGTAVFNDEAMTEPAADGDHVLADGRTVTVAAGLVTAIAEAVIEDENTDNEALNARIAELESQLAEKENQLNEATTALNASNEAIKQIKDLKSKFVPKDRTQNFTKPEENKPESKFVKPTKNKK
ncbi:MAG: Clp protease ClpP [Sphingobacteriaceae bacterium]|jgi:ATP-dependent protease ClpP protease subunit/uncharacterized coiled-coil protein SlyX|nr:Clp protease ClpP [Sphingobacteriaceae bacterium]